MNPCTTFSLVGLAFIIASVVSLFSLIFLALRPGEISSLSKNILWGVMVVGLLVGGLLMFTFTEYILC